jgi:hypothetical protein
LSDKGKAKNREQEETLYACHAELSK